MQDVEVNAVSHDGHQLAGTLTLPDAPSRALVVMIHGTGPLDRDENVPGQPAGHRIDLFNTLARDLAAAGFASLRYDKRGCGGSAGGYWSHGQIDLVKDAAAWADAMRLRPEVTGPLVLLGHSEGTIIAPRLAAMRSDVAGLVLICPFLQPMARILQRQAAALAQEARVAPGFGGWLQRVILGLLGGLERVQDRLIARLQASDKPVIRVMGRRVTARSLRDLLVLDNRAVHAGHGLPTLLLVAGRDLQCPPEDGAAIAALNPRARLVEIPDLTHILRREAGTRGFAGYQEQLRRPVDPEVGRIVTLWLSDLAGS